MALPFPPWRLGGGPKLPALGSTRWNICFAIVPMQELGWALEIAIGVSKLILAARAARRRAPG
jgi:hypothetical protein